MDILPASVQLHILSLLPPNERALNGRLVSPDMAAVLHGPEHCTVSLSQPLPPSAVARAQEVGQQVRQWPLSQRMQLLYAAAASGSELSMQVASELLQPGFFLELLQHGGFQ